MGNCSNSEQNQMAEPRLASFEKDTPKGQQNKLQALNIISSFEQKKGEQRSLQTNHLSELIRQNWPVYPLIKDLLAGFSYTEESLINIAKMGADAIIAIENNETPEEKKAINDFLSSKEKEILNDQLYYDDILKLLQDHFKEVGLTLKTCGKKRAFLQMANIKKNQKVIKKDNSIPEFKIVSSTDYKELSEEEIEEAIKLQHIGQQMKELGEELSFKMLQVKQQTEKMRKLLIDVLLKNIKELEAWKPIGKWRFDMNPLEVYIISKIARQACEYYENGVYILLVYFMESCRKLEENGKEPIASIELKLKDSIEFIAYLYPPGSGLNQLDPELEENLKKIEKKLKFESKVHQFAEKINEQQRFQRLKEIVTEHAKSARDNKKHLERLIRKTCLKRCIDFTTGLKYNPDKPNEKALTRIQEKLLLKKDVEVKRQLKSSIKEVLDKEETEYKESVKQQLSSMKALPFTISDMVRGKCIFLSIQDIMETVDDIKKFIQRQNQSNLGLFKIYEVESRFTRQPPISDITLKIGIKDEILAQLQLTLQTNKAAYNFAHKIYEFNRAKAFSKIKVINNYYQQFSKDFTEVAEKQVIRITKQIKQTKQTDTSQIQKIQLMKDYLLLRNNPANTSYQSDLLLSKIKERLVERLQNKTKYMQFTKSDKQYMKQIVQLKTKINQKNVNQFVDKLNQCLNKSQSTIQQRALLLYFFLSDRNIQPFILKKQSLKTVIYTDSKTLLEQILKLKVTDQLFTANPKSYFYLQKIFEIFENKFAHQKIIHRDLLKTDNSIQNIESLQKLAVFYYRKKDLPTFYNIYDNLLKLQRRNIIETNKFSQIKLLKIQSLILNYQFKKATQDLNFILEEFKEKKNTQGVIESQILLAQCYLKQIYGSSQESKQFLANYTDFYKKAEQQSKLDGIQLKGALIGESSWRMAEYIFGNFKYTQQDKRRVANTHYRIAFNQFVKYKSFQQLEKIKEKWLYFQKYYLQFPQKRHFTSIVKGLQKHSFTIGNPNVYELMKYYLYMKNANLKSLQLHQKIQKKYWELIQEVSEDYSANLNSFKIKNPEVNNFACNILRHFSNLKELVIRSKHCGNIIWNSVTKRKMPYLQVLTLDADYSIEQIFNFMYTQLSVITLDLFQVKQYYNSYPKSTIQVTTFEQTIWKRSKVDLNASKALPKLMLMSNKKKILIIQQLHIYQKKIELKQNRIIWSKESFKETFNEFIKLINKLNDSEQIQNIFQLTQWQTATSLDIDFKQFSKKAAYYCSKANFNAVTQLNLENMSIQDIKQGIQKLNIIKDNILELSVYKISCNAEASDYILGFKNLIKLDLRGSIPRQSEYSGAEEFLMLIQSYWGKLKYLNLEDNKIGTEGCKYLANDLWNQLAYLNIGKNYIGDNGCQFISKAQWPKLTSLILSYNSIGKKGCQELSKAKWNKNIVNIDLSHNNLSSQGVLALIQAQWINLASINLSDCNIKYLGFQLSRAKWNNLTALNLGYNIFDQQQYLYKFKNSCFRQKITIFIDITEHKQWVCRNQNSDGWSTGSYEQKVIEQSSLEYLQTIFPSLVSNDWKEIQYKIQKDWVS